MNKPNKCKNCQWYGKPYWSIINPCDNCPNENSIQTTITIDQEKVFKEWVDNVIDPIEQCQKLQKEVDKLKKENEFLKLNNPEMNIRHFRVIKENKRKINNLRAENKRLKDSLETMAFTAKIKQEAIDSLIARIDKAIEYIKENEFKASDGEVCYFCNMQVIKDLLNILQGDKG